MSSSTNYLNSIANTSTPLNISENLPAYAPIDNMAILTQKLLQVEQENALFRRELTELKNYFSFFKK